MASTETVVHPCQRCGSDAPYDFLDLWLCLDCYHIAGSTCSGIGRSWGLRTAPPGAVPESGAVC